MRTVVVYKRKRKKERWVYMPFPTVKMAQEFEKRAKKAGINVKIKIGGY